MNYLAMSLTIQFKNSLSSQLDEYVFYFFSASSFHKGSSTWLLFLFSWLALPSQICPISFLPITLHPAHSPAFPPASSSTSLSAEPLGEARSGLGNLPALRQSAALLDVSHVLLCMGQTLTYSRNGARLGQFLQISSHSLLAEVFHMGKNRDV